MDDQRREQEEKEGILTLNVGGMLFTTTLQTLRKDRESMLARMFAEDDGSGETPRLGLKRDKDGNVFIDRDGTHFREILNFLRDGFWEGPLPRGRHRTELKREADFYQISELIAALGGGSASAKDGEKKEKEEIVVLQGSELQLMAWENIRGANVEIYERCKKLVVDAVAQQLEYYKSSVSVSIPCKWHDGHWILTRLWNDEEAVGGNNGELTAEVISALVWELREVHGWSIEWQHNCLAISLLPTMKPDPNPPKLPKPQPDRFPREQILLSKRWEG